MDYADRIVDKIVADIGQRRGLQQGWNQTNNNTLIKIRNAWATIIRSATQPADSADPINKPTEKPIDWINRKHQRMRIRAADLFIMTAGGVYESIVICLAHSRGNRTVSIDIT